MGGAVIYWFTGASCQAVVTGAYRAVVYIKEHMKLDSTTASMKDSKEVVRICTVYAQKGMWNIFIVVFCFALGASLLQSLLLHRLPVGIGHEDGLEEAEERDADQVADEEVRIEERQRQREAEDRR